MRIQHNIMAMNSYRNFSNNTSKLSKNLEKLSSGYRINRAGDDAAGLAISEKMRAQISGLEQAQSNAKSGVNLVQTAEGALTEVHDMLNRMVTLSEQSANGTFDDEVDRANLQKEFNQLRSEIDRIADSSNFNGINLLDGSLSSTGANRTTATQLDLSKLSVDLKVNSTTVSATKGQVTSEKFFNNSSNTHAMAAGDTLTYKINYTDDNGKAQTKELTFKLGKTSTGTADQGLYLDDGSEKGVLISTLGAPGVVESGELATAVKKAVEQDSDLNALFTVDAVDVTGGADGVRFTARQGGTSGASVTSSSLTFYDKSDTGATPKTTWEVGVQVTRAAEDEKTAIDFSKALIFDASLTAATAKATHKIEDAIFEINGEKFVFIQNGKENDVDVQKALREAGVTHWVAATAANSVTSNAVASMVNKINTATGLRGEKGATAVNAGTGEITWTGGAGTKVVFRVPDATKENTGTGGLTLQIGDTSDSFNQLTVSIEDMHAKALGIDEVDIGTQKGAQGAVKTIKDAINSVSSTRGTLGAAQNRLDHTINNLSVMQENIQDAESTIRDVDVAKEMMDYTKNNILIQSAQAMLAQANQVPQGVLQLLQ